MDYKQVDKVSAVEADEVVTVGAEEAGDVGNVGDVGDVDETEVSEIDKERCAKAIRFCRDVYPSAVSGELYVAPAGVYMGYSVLMGRMAGKFGLNDKERAYVGAAIKGRACWSEAGVIDETNEHKEFASDDWLSGFNLANSYFKRIPKAHQQPDSTGDALVAGKAMKEAQAAMEDLTAGLMAMATEDELVWLRRWVASQVLTPCRKLNQVVVLSDKGGTGKSTLGRAIRYAISGKLDSRQGLKMGNVSELLSDFWSGQLIGRTFIQIDEASTRSGQVVERLKAACSGNQLSVNAKGRPQYQAQFVGDFLICSNNTQQPMPWEAENRRFYWFQSASDGVKAAKALNILLDSDDPLVFDGAIMGIVNACREWRGSTTAVRSVQGGKTSAFKLHAKLQGTADESLSDELSAMLASKVAVSLFGVRREDTTGILSKVADSKLNALLDGLGWKVETVDYKGSDAETIDILMHHFGKVRGVRAWVSPEGQELMAAAGGGSKVVRLVQALGKISKPEF